VGIDNMDEKIKILVIDDDNDFCQNVKDVMELKDYLVDMAFDSQKGLETAIQNRYDIVLLDIKMPVMNGVETFKKIKKASPDTPVIMMTAYAVEELIQDALRGGAFGSLMKPLDFDKLFSIIENALHKGMLLQVVDDDENLSENIKDILTERGFKVIIANDSNTAIKNAREHNFDVMLFDVKLTPLNGLEAYLVIRDIRPDVIVIIITGYRKELSDIVDEALRKKVYACIEKPIEMDALITVLNKIEEEKAKRSNIKHKTESESKNKT
jgi:DNA-binding NtrC family response regulator